MKKEKQEGFKPFDWGKSSRVKSNMKTVVHVKPAKRVAKVVEIPKAIVAGRPVAIIVKVVGPETEAQILASKLRAYLKSDLEMR